MVRFWGMVLEIWKNKWGMFGTLEDLNGFKLRGFGLSMVLSKGFLWCFLGLSQRFWWLSMEKPVIVQEGPLLFSVIQGMTVLLFLFDNLFFLLKS